MKFNDWNNPTSLQHILNECSNKIEVIERMGFIGKIATFVQN